MATGDAVAIACMLLAIGGFGIAVGPRFVGGAADEPRAERLPAGAERRGMTVGLKQLLAGSKVLLDERNGELLLWFSDIADPGTLNESEIVLLSHSPIMRTITAFTHEGGATDEVLALATGTGPADKPIELAALADPDFFERWRRREGVQPSVIATGVTAVRVERNGQPDDPDRLRVALTWASGPADEGISEAWFEVRLPALVGLGGPSR